MNKEMTFDSVMQRLSVLAEQRRKLIEISSVFPRFGLDIEIDLEDIRDFVRLAEENGYPLADLYPILVSGKLPDDLNTLICHVLSVWIYTKDVR